MSSYTDDNFALVTINNPDDSEKCVTKVFRHFQESFGENSFAKEECKYTKHAEKNVELLLCFKDKEVAKEAVNIREKNVECADNKHIHITVEKWERNCSVSRPVLCDLPDSLYLMPSLPSTQESEEGRSEESTANKEHRQSDDPDETKVKSLYQVEQNQGPDLLMTGLMTDRGASEKLILTLHTGQLTGQLTGISSEAQKHVDPSSHCQSMVPPPNVPPMVSERGSCECLDRELLDTDQTERSTDSIQNPSSRIDCQRPDFRNKTRHAPEPALSVPEHVSQTEDRASATFEEETTVQGDDEHILQNHARSNYTDSRYQAGAIPKKYSKESKLQRQGTIGQKFPQPNKCIIVHGIDPNHTEEERDAILGIFTKNGGGEIEDSFFSVPNKTLEITFVDPKAASKILLRKAFEFNGKQLTACFKTDKRKVLMKHVPVEAHYQDILHLLERMSGRKTKEFNVKYSEYPGTYLVEFCEETDLEPNIQDEIFGQVTFAELPYSSTIKVDGLGLANADITSIREFFEQRFHDGVFDISVMSTCTLITFADYQVVELLLQSSKGSKFHTEMEHVFGKADFSVSVYHEEAGLTSNPPVTRFKQTYDKHLLELWQLPENMHKLEKIMKKHHAKIAFKGTRICIECVLDMNDQQNCRMACSWAKNIQSEMDKFLKRFAMKTFRLLHEDEWMQVICVLNAAIEGEKLQARMYPHKDKSSYLILVYGEEKSVKVITPEIWRNNQHGAAYTYFIALDQPICMYMQNGNYPQKLREQFGEMEIEVRDVREKTLISKSRPGILVKGTAKQFCSVARKIEDLEQDLKDNSFEYSVNTSCLPVRPTVSIDKMIDAFQQKYNCTITRIQHRDPAGDTGKELLHIYRCSKDIEITQDMIGEWFHEYVMSLTTDKQGGSREDVKEVDKQKMKDKQTNEIWCDRSNTPSNQYQQGTYSNNAEMQSDISSLTASGTSSHGIRRPSHSTQIPVVDPKGIKIHLPDNMEDRDLKLLLKRCSDLKEHQIHITYGWQKQTAWVRLDGLKYETEYVIKRMRDQLKKSNTARLTVEKLHYPTAVEVHEPNKKNREDAGHIMHVLGIESFVSSMPHPKLPDCAVVTVEDFRDIENLISNASEYGMKAEPHYPFLWPKLPNY